MVNNTNLIGIIPAAGLPINNILSNSSLPNCMVPINGKPVIGYIVEDLILRGVSKIIIILNPSDIYTERYLQKKYYSSIKIEIIYNNEISKGVVYSIYLALNFIPNGGKTLVILGDTIYKGELNFNNNFIVVSNSFENPQKWCFVENKNSKLYFINKPKSYSNSGSVICGVYFFSSLSNLIFSYEQLNSINQEFSNIEISDLLFKYQENESFTLVNAKDWYDCGNIENYYKARIDFLKVRSFNSIVYNDLYGTITKSSKKASKILEEINWYLNIPEQFKIFMPRLVDCYVNSENPNYTLEFYGYQTLADAFIFESYDFTIWKKIIERLFEILRLFQEVKVQLNPNVFHKVYYFKLLDRLKEIDDNINLENIYKTNFIKIGGINYNNLPFYLEKIKQSIEILINSDQMTFIHGDLFLGNILFDSTSKIFKFIDPRGNFGDVGIYGDTKYDIAKLRHSFVGNYDFIVADLFTINYNDEVGWDFKILNEKYHEQISNYFDLELEKNGYDLNQIKFIEALLFISMVPLHSDNIKRQQAMYLTGILKLNELNI